MQVALTRLGIGSTSGGNGGSGRSSASGSERRAKKMLRVNVPLDPSRTGREAEALEVSLGRLIVGQDEAIQQIVNIYQMYLTGMTAPGRPIGNFLFLGPTGSGKTRIVEATAESMATAIVRHFSDDVLKARSST